MVLKTYLLFGVVLLVSATAGRGAATFTLQDSHGDASRVTDVHPGDAIIVDLQVDTSSPLTTAETYLVFSSAGAGKLTALSFSKGFDAAGEGLSLPPAFRSPIKLDPRDPAAHRALGLAYVQEGNAELAVRHLKRYLRASPGAADRPLIEKRIEQRHLGPQ